MSPAQKRFTSLECFMDGGLALACKSFERNATFGGIHDVVGGVRHGFEKERCLLT